MANELVDWPELLRELNAACYQTRSQHAVSTLARLQRARQLIEERWSESLDLNQLAKAACLSPYHFARLFRQEFGETPHQLLTRRRISEAKRLLLLDHDVTDVTLRVGFSSPGTFSSLFSRHVGVAPSRYRHRVWQVPHPVVVVPVPQCFQMVFG